MTTVFWTPTGHLGLEAGSALCENGPAATDCRAETPARPAPVSFDLGTVRCTSSPDAHDKATQATGITVIHPTLLGGQAPTPSRPAHSLAQRRN